ncbi:unnamed protein product [Adineta ricciae]|uniref:Sorting nexin-14 n=1 Tax=Adineta ricciae TaxID=249248 RepID=A0A814WB06_ADIRI|nr:unnamed protein product [Adineta ricciae]
MASNHDSHDEFLDDFHKEFGKEGKINAEQAWKLMQKYHQRKKEKNDKRSEESSEGEHHDRRRKDKKKDRRNEDPKSGESGEDEHHGRRRKDKKKDRRNEDPKSGESGEDEHHDRRRKDKKKDRHSDDEKKDKKSHGKECCRCSPDRGHSHERKHSRGHSHDRKHSPDHGHRKHKHVFRYWWCIFLLPLSTICASFAIKHLCRSGRSPFKISGYIYNLLFKANQNSDHSSQGYEISIQKECDTYIRIIVARYICVWYYPLVSTDQEFPEDLMIIFNIMLNRLNDRLKSLNSYDLTRLLVNLEQKHLEQYLHALDSYEKQRKHNPSSKSIVEEYSHLIGFHRSMINNDTHVYLKALVELFLTDLVPESFHMYSGSHTGREFLTQLVVHCVFLPLLNEFSNPQMLYYLIVRLFETEESKLNEKTDEHTFSIQTEPISGQHDKIQPEVLREDLDEHVNLNDGRRISRLERIIYSVTIISCDIAYNARTGGAYTVYIMQCETKSPFASDTVHRYVIRRRFREFMNLHKRLHQNLLTSRYWHDMNEVFQNLPLPIDNMNVEVIRRRKEILERYIQKLISNEVLNCSHDVLEFFAYNSDSNVQFEPLPPSKLPVPRVDRVLLRTLSDVGTKLNNLLPTKRELTPIRETFQLNISTTYEDTSPVLEQMKFFIQQSSLRYSSYSLSLNSIDSEFLQSLLTRPSIVTSQRKAKSHSSIPLTDSILKLIHTCLDSRDDIISYESTHQIFRTLFGHFTEEFFKDYIDKLLSQEKILEYLYDIRTKVLWPDESKPTTPMKDIKNRAFTALMKKIPNWLQFIVGTENTRRIIKNFLDSLNYTELNRHLICNLFDLLLEQLVPHIATKDFLTKYVHMHAGVRS